MEIIGAHKSKSREVTQSDLPRVIRDTQEMLRIVNEPIGMYPAGYALAHPQVTDEDPLRFFVTNHAYEQVRNGGLPVVIINPEIQVHTKHPIEHQEGCLSFSKLPLIKMQRWNKITVKFQWLGQDGRLNHCLAEKRSGFSSFIFQHEIDHLNAVYIYGWL